MYLKILGGIALPDHDTRQTFRMLSDVIAVNFDRYGGPTQAEREWNPVAIVTFSDLKTETFSLHGNAYLMNDDGKTIASFAWESPPDEIMNAWQNEPPAP